MRPDASFLTDPVDPVDETTAIEALDRSLDSLLDDHPGRADAPPRRSSPLGETAVALRALDDARPPDPTFVAHLEEQLMSATAVDSTRPRAIAPPSTRPRMASVPPAVGSRPPLATGRRRGLIEFASLAAVVALLFGQSLGIGGNLAFWQDTVPAPVAGDPTAGLTRVDSGRSGAYPAPDSSSVPHLRWTSDPPSSGAAYRQPIAGDDGLLVADPVNGGISKVHDDGSVSLLVDQSGLATYAVDDGTVYVASGRGTNGALSAYPDGAADALWRVETSESAGALGLDGERIFMVDIGGVLRAFDPVDGSEAWTVDLGVGDTSTIFQPPSYVMNDPSPAVAGGLLVVGTPDGEVRAFAAEDGTPRWAFDAPEALVGAPTIVDGTVYVAARGSAEDAPGVPGEGHVYALDGETGTERWSHPLVAWTTAAFRSSPSSSEDVLVLTVDGTSVYLNGDGADGDEITALDAATGEPRWSVGFGVASGPAPVVAGDTLHAARPDGGVYALDTATGEQRWRLDAGTADLRSPALIGSFLLVTTSEGTVFGLGQLVLGADATPRAAPTAVPDATVDISGLPACVAPRVLPDPLPTGEPAATLDVLERLYVPGNASVIRADLPTEPLADAEDVAGILDTIRAMDACDRPGRERELSGFFTDDYYRRVAIRHPGQDPLRSPTAGQVLVGYTSPWHDDPLDAVALEDGRVAQLLWQEQWREGSLVIFVEQDGRWLIDEVAGITEEHGQPKG